MLFVCFRVHSADHYLQEAKKLKHNADALVSAGERGSGGEYLHIKFGCQCMQEVEGVKYKKATSCEGFKC